MATTAILIDGGYYRKVSNFQGILGATGEEAANNLMKYCSLHLKDKDENIPRTLYRIFYYDCHPFSGTVYHPFTKEDVDMEGSASSVWTKAFYTALRSKRKVALRLGDLSPVTAQFMLKPEIIKDLFSGKKTLEQITKSDFRFDIRQKGVDMRIGLDIASMAHKKQVNQIILIAGDSDFIPAVKHARREGIDVILDCMGQHITDKLSEHVDGMFSHYGDLKKELKRRSDPKTISGKTPTKKGAINPTGHQ